MKLSDIAEVKAPSGAVTSSAPKLLKALAFVKYPLDPWQERLIYLWEARTALGGRLSDMACLSSPRQVGKTYTLLGYCLARCLLAKTTVVWTAHHSRVMLDTLMSAAALVSRPGVAPYIAAIRRSAEDRSIVFANGSRIVFAARETGALRGVSRVDLLICDEAQILSESALADIVPVMNAAKDSMMILAGTPPRPEDPAPVWRRLRESAGGDDEGDRVSWVELSAPRGCDSDDKTAWLAANPSCPARTPVRAIARMRATLPEGDFRREALGLWDDDAAALVAPDLWAALGSDTELGMQPVALAVEVSGDGSSACVSYASRAVSDAGKIFVELDEARVGTDWVVQWVADRVTQGVVGCIVYDHGGPAAMLGPQLRRLRVPVVEMRHAEAASATLGFLAAVQGGVVCHAGQPQLAAAVAALAWRDSGGRKLWQRKGAAAALPAVAASWAWWAVHEGKTARRQRGAVL